MSQYPELISYILLNGSEWMSKLDQNISLKALSIPEHTIQEPIKFLQQHLEQGIRIMTLNNSWKTEFVFWISDM